MNLKKHLTTCVIVAIVAAWSPFGGATTYDEAVDGDLSGNGAAPTSLIFGPGSHSISGTTVALDYDIIHLAIGGEFQSLVLSSYASVDNLAFIGVQSGTTWTEGLGGPSIRRTYSVGRISVPVTAPSAPTYSTTSERAPALWGSFRHCRPEITRFSSSRPVAAQAITHSNSPSCRYHRLCSFWGLSCW